MMKDAPLAVSFFCLFTFAFPSTPVADEDEGCPEVGVRVRDFAAGLGDGLYGESAACGVGGRALAFAGRHARRRPRAAAQQFELRLAERLGLQHAVLRVAYPVELLHQQARARVGHGPQRSHDGLRALALREHAEALDLLAVAARAARRRVAGRERQKVNAAEEVLRDLDLRERQACAVAEQEVGVRLVARLKLEVARHVDEREALAQTSLERLDVER